MTKREGFTLLVREGGAFCDKNVKIGAGLRGLKTRRKSKNDKFVIFGGLVEGMGWRWRVPFRLGMFSA
ncbi:MAG: hypothetical protein ACI4WT_05890 [Oligosphaeraceae bacterium]